MIELTYPRGRAITSGVEVDIDTDYGAPVLMIQNTGATDANVIFNGGVAFVVRASETLPFSVPVMGKLTSDQDLIALA